MSPRGSQDKIQALKLAMQNLSPSEHFLPLQGSSSLHLKLLPCCKTHPFHHSLQIPTPVTSCANFSIWRSATNCPFPGETDLFLKD